MTTCALIPTYNNVGTVADVVRQVLRYLPVIVVVDGATDGSLEAVQAIEDERLHIVYYSTNRGKGYALKQGFQEARALGFTHVLTIDSDGQHYPDDIKWGPMHWGHAVSKDGINWEHKKIALFPDESGYIFSGSCVLDTENVSGFGDGIVAALLAFYTCHDPHTEEQQQCIAYSLDYENFTPYAGNPIISNKKTMPCFKKDFRDYLCLDGIHPNEKGHRLIADAVCDHFNFKK